MGLIPPAMLFSVMVGSLASLLLPKDKPRNIVLGLVNFGFVYKFCPLTLGKP